MYRQTIKNKLKPIRLMKFAIIILLLYKSAIATKLNPLSLIQGIENVISLMARMLPPNFGVWRQVLSLSLETIYIAITATTLAIIISFPLSLMAAKNTTPHPITYHVIRNILNFLRGVPELIFALLFVVAVGMGPFAGVLALATHTIGVLGKIFAEYIEEAKLGPQEAIISTGATKLQVIYYGIIPQIIPNILAMIFYRFEVNVRSATVLGFVGAGGIGFYLLTAMRLLNYSTSITCIIAILIMVGMIDYLGSFIRLKRI